MTTATITPPAPFGAITTHRFVSTVERLLVQVSDHLAARRTRITLSSLSDEALRDIGLTRWDVETLDR